MKRKLHLLPLLASTMVLSSPALAVESSDPQIQQILARTQALENELSSLKAQLKQLKRSTVAKKSKTTQQKVTTTHLVAKQNEKSYAATEKRVEANTTVGDQADFTSGQYYLGSAVVISPFIGLRSDFDHKDLVVNISDINTDLRLLKQRQRLHDQQAARRVAAPEGIVLELSGAIEAQAFTNQPYTGHSRGDIDLSAAKLDVAAEVNQWASGFIAMNYDNSATSPRRIDNSRVFLDRGFITLGNLNASPWYFTAGQIYAPFGQYDSFALSSTLTKLVGRTKARAALLGFQQTNENPWNGQVYLFHGNTKSRGSAQYGVQVERLFDVRPGHQATVGAGFISSLAESDGMQKTGGDGFEGFRDSTASERLERRVPAADIHGGMSVGPFDLVGEYLTAIRHFDSLDLQYDSHGARPQAFNFEANYKFNTEVPTALALGYGFTKEALALELPKHRFTATVNTSFWKGTIESLEYRHDINYSSHHTAAGRAGADGVLASTPTAPLGKTSDMITAQVGIYF